MMMMMMMSCSGAQSFAELSRRKMAADSRPNSDDGAVTSSDGDGRARSKSDHAHRRLCHRRTVDVVDADRISRRPVRELRPSADRSCPANEVGLSLEPAADLPASGAWDARDPRTGFYLGFNLRGGVTQKQGSLPSPASPHSLSPPPPRPPPFPPLPSP